VLDGYGDKTAIEARCEAIRQAVEESTSDYDKCAPAPNARHLGRVSTALWCHKTLRCGQICDTTVEGI